jgi:polyisoprenoid-binding protein YceI
MTMTETGTPTPAPQLRTVDGAELPVPGTYTLDITHSAVLFAVRHLGLSQVRGLFGTFDGVVTIAERPEDSTVAVDIDPASVDTRLAFRDERLRGDDFFDVAHHPTMSFRSTRVAGSGSTWTVEGDLTIRGVTQPVTLDVTFQGAAVDPWGGRRIAFAATGQVDRERWGLTWNQTLDTGGVFVGRTVRFDLEVEAVQQYP